MWLFTDLVVRSVWSAHNYPYEGAHADEKIPIIELYRDGPHYDSVVALGECALSSFVEMMFNICFIWVCLSPANVNAKKTPKQLCNYLDSCHSLVQEYITHLEDSCNDVDTDIMKHLCTLKEAISSHCNSSTRMKSTLYGQLLADVNSWITRLEDVVPEAVRSIVPQLCRLGDTANIHRVGFIGTRGSGKSSMANRILSEDLLPTGRSAATTAAIAEVIGWDNPDYAATVLFHCVLEHLGRVLRGR
jgi:hypothetical protein